MHSNQIVSTFLYKIGLVITQIEEEHEIMKYLRIWIQNISHKKYTPSEKECLNFLKTQITVFKVQLILKIKIITKVS